MAFHIANCTGDPPGDVLLVLLADPGEKECIYIRIELSGTDCNISHAALCGEDSLI